jgi:imidazole glycerol phosphate synthase subunit HisF
MTQAAGCQFGTCNLSGPNITLMIELFQFQDSGNASAWLNNVHLPRLVALMNDSTDSMTSSAPDGNGTLINYVAYDGINDGWDLAFQQGVFVCRVMIIAPTGTTDIEVLVNYIAEAQNEKILKALA